MTTRNVAANGLHRQAGGRFGTFVMAADGFASTGRDTTSALVSEGGALAQRLAFVQLRLQELRNLQALLTKARNAYLADLKTELIRPAQDGDPAYLPALLRSDGDTF